MNELCYIITGGRNDYGSEPFPFESHRDGVVEPTCLHRRRRLPGILDTYLRE
jgi:hypothetical protein